MKKLSTIIVDDEPLALEGLKTRLAQFPNIELVAECANGDEAIVAAGKHNPDVMFLDLEMPGLSGFEVVQALQSDVMPLIVFVTAYQQYAVEAFDIHAVDYILKPADLERLQRAIDKVMQRMQGSQAREDKQCLLKALSQVSGTSNDALENWLEEGSEFPEAKNDVIAIKNVGKTTVMLPMGDIEWVDAAGDYMCIHAAGETHVLRITLKKLEKLLDPKTFKRIHKSTIVNVTSIHEVIPRSNSECILVLKDTTRLKVSRNYKDNIQEFIQSYTP